MSNEPLPIGPDRDGLIRLIRETWLDAVVEAHDRLAERPTRARTI